MQVWFPVSGRFPGGVHDNPLQYSCLENPTDREAWWAKQSTELHRVTHDSNNLESTHTCLKQNRIYFINFGVYSRNTTLMYCLKINKYKCIYHIHQKVRGIVISISSVQSLSRVWLFATPWNTACQASLSTPRAYSNSCPLSRWFHPTVSSSVILFSSCLQLFPASGSFPMSQFFASGGQSIGVSASASVLPMNIQDWSL